MRIPVSEMTREQLMAELPRRMLVMAVFLAMLGVIFSVLAFIAMHAANPMLWTVLFLGALMLSPFPVARVARWMVLPAHERIQRRKRLMRSALADCAFQGGDSCV
jgi:predicted lysophospholipase L1 biosynthesis ABC-type transport system permease subunit